MTESVFEKVVAMVCLVALIVGGKIWDVDKEMLYTGIAIICAMTGLGTGTGRISLQSIGLRKGGQGA